MATLFEPSLSSTGAMRSSVHLADAPSMADSLPSISFGFDDLRDRMARFTEKFDSFIAKGRKQVLAERNHFRVNVAELQEEQRVKQKNIELLAHKSSDHARSIEKEAVETAEMHAAIASITHQRDTCAQHRDRVRTETAAVRKQIAQRLAAQQEHAKSFDIQASFNNPELDFWQSYLAMRIDGMGVPDRLKFVFSHVDEKNWGREAWFELDMEKGDCRVICVKPKLEPDQIKTCVRRLNENRDLGGFLKGMRGLFIAALK
ncbi:MAG: hypothetical protein Q9194_001378 [Teloschistes cf. exilis]